MSLKTIATVMETPAVGEYPPGTWKVEATYGIEGDDHLSYFSLTGRAWRRAGNGRLRCEPHISGRIRPLIVAAFPWLDLFAQVHLRNAVTGEPLHARENAWFWFCSTRPVPVHERVWIPTAWTHLDGAGRAGAYLGCDPELFDSIPAFDPADRAAKNEFAARVDLLRPGWAQLAQSVRGMYRLDVPTGLDTPAPHDLAHEHDLARVGGR